MPSSHQLRSTQPAVSVPHPRYRTDTALQPKTECDGLDESSGLRLHNPGQTACTGQGLVYWPGYYRPRHDGGPVSLTAPVPSVSVVTGPRALSPLVRLVMATGPGPRQPGPAPQLTVCCTGSAGPGLRNSSVSHSALARPATSDTGDPSYSEPVSPDRESPSNPLSASSQI